MQLLTKGMLMVVMLLLISFGIRAWLDPSPYYGNDNFALKRELFQDDTLAYNNLMIGSSCIYWNLDPQLFDMLQPPESGTLSYNFGGGGTLPPETYHFFEHLLADEPEGIQSIIIELRDIGRFQEHHLHTLRMRYFMSPRWFLFVARATLAGNQPPGHRRKMIARYGIAMVERILNIDYFNALHAPSEEQRQKSAERRENLLTRGIRGHLPVHADREAEAERGTRHDVTLAGVLANTYREIMMHPEQIQVNKVHLKQLDRILEQCRERGVHCLFLLHPKHEDEVAFREAVALAMHLPPTHVIDLADPDRYPELYLPENSPNRNHFNTAGTMFLTNFAARQFADKHREWFAVQ